MQPTRNKSQENPDNKSPDLSNLSLYELLHDFHFSQLINREESKITVPDQDKTPTTPTKSSQKESNQGSSRSGSALDWRGCVGYDEVKKVLLETILLPVKFPQLFPERRSNMSIFLYGVTFIILAS